MKKATTLKKNKIHLNVFEKTIIIILSLLGVIDALVVLSVGAVFAVGIGSFIHDSFPSKYVKSSNWNCDLETFQTEYCEAYLEKIEELEKKYDLSIEKEVERHDEYNYSIYLMTEEYAIRIVLHENGDFGSIDVYLGQKLDEENKPKDFDFEPVLNFINDFVNFAGYDTKTDKNYFEVLYLGLLESGSTFDSYIYHRDYYTDRVIRNGVGYKLSKKRTDGSYVFEFNGLLKPLDLD